MCDLADCKTLDRRGQDFWAWKWANDDCRARRVDWRARALAAESALSSAEDDLGAALYALTMTGDEYWREYGGPVDGLIARIRTRLATKTKEPAR